MSNISDRIKKIIEYEEISVRKFEQKIGASNGLISKSISKNTDIGSIWVSKIIESFPNINALWLLTGDGEMLNSKNPSIEIEKDNLTKLIEANLTLSKSSQNLSESIFLTAESTSKLVSNNDKLITINDKNSELIIKLCDK